MGFASPASAAWNFRAKSPRSGTRWESTERMRARGLAAPSLPNQEPPWDRQQDRQWLKQKHTRAGFGPLSPCYVIEGALCQGEVEAGSAPQSGHTAGFKGRQFGKRDDETMEFATQWKESSRIRIMDSKRQTSINSGSCGRGLLGK